MSARTHTLSGHYQSEKHSPLYQGVIAVKCSHCPKAHKLLLTSDERAMVEVQVDGLVITLREAGYRVAAVLVESYHPGTDLSIRDWQEVERLMDNLAGTDLPF